MFIYIVEFLCGAAVGAALTGIYFLRWRKPG